MLTPKLSFLSLSATRSIQRILIVPTLLLCSGAFFILATFLIALMFWQVLRIDAAGILIAALLSVAAWVFLVNRMEWKLISKKAALYISLANMLGLAILGPPLLLRPGCRSSNDAVAAGGLKTIVAAQEEFRAASYDRLETYARSLQELQFTGGDPATGIRLIDESLGAGIKSGYEYQLHAHSFVCPVGQSGVVHGSGKQSLRLSCMPDPDAICLIHKEKGAFLGWWAEAHPVFYGKTGHRSFYIDHTGVLRGQDIQGKPGHATLPEI